jgi:hypothetical protein
MSSATDQSPHWTGPSRPFVAEFLKRWGCTFGVASIASLWLAHVGLGPLVKTLLNFGCLEWDDRCWWWEHSHRLGASSGLDMRCVGWLCSQLGHESRPSHSYALMYSWKMLKHKLSSQLFGMFVISFSSFVFFGLELIRSCHLVEPRIWTVQRHTADCSMCVYPRNFLES